MTTGDRYMSVTGGVATIVAIKGNAVTFRLGDDMFKVSKEMFIRNYRKI